MRLPESEGRGEENLPVGCAPGIDECFQTALADSESRDCCTILLPGIDSGFRKNGLQCEDGRS